MTQPLAKTTTSARATPPALRADLRDLARRAVVLCAATAGLAGILAGRPLLAVLLRAGALCCAGITLVVAVEAVVRRANRRVVR